MPRIGHKPSLLLLFFIVTHSFKNYVAKRTIMYKNEMLLHSQQLHLRLQKEKCQQFLGVAAHKNGYITIINNT
jgi:hypothetical protein